MKFHIPFSVLGRRGPFTPFTVVNVLMLPNVLCAHSIGRDMR